MSEVEKLYKIAGVEKQYYYFDSADGNTYTWELNENGNDKHNMCFIGTPKIKDREFTAEKQIELIKWLSRRYIEISNYDAENGRMYNIKPTVGDFATSFNYDFSECIAGLINNLWQDLTEQERTEITEILRG